MAANQSFNGAIFLACNIPLVEREEEKRRAVEENNGMAWMMEKEGIKNENALETIDLN